MFATLPALAELGPQEQKLLLGRCTTRFAAPGDLILRKGAAGEAMFFISSGTVSVQLAGGAVRLGRGDFFGEMALLSDAPRMADVMAEGYVRLLVLNRDGFEVLGEAAPALARAVAEAAQARGRTQAG